MTRFVFYVLNSLANFCVFFVMSGRFRQVFKDMFRGLFAKLPLLRSSSTPGGDNKPVSETVVDTGSTNL